MQRNNGDYNETTNATEWTLKNTLWTLGTMIVLCLIVGGYFWYPGYQQGQEAEAAKVAKAEQEKRKAGYQSAIKAAMFGPQKTGRTGKTKMAQIEQGGIGTADLISSGCELAPSPNFFELYDASMNLIVDGPLNVETFNGWTAGAGGSVAPPLDAEKINYKLKIYSAESCGGGDYVVYLYDFEVIEAGTGITTPPVRTGAIVNAEGEIEISFDRAVKPTTNPLGFGIRWLDCFDKTLENGHIESISVAGNVVKIITVSRVKIGEDVEDFYDDETGNVVSDDEDEIPLVTYITQPIVNNSERYNTSMAQFL